VNREIRRLRKVISQADAIVLSSYSAFEDFRAIAPEDCVPRARVLQFVSQPDTRLGSVGAAGTEVMERKYGFRGRYFYLPNQFWVHKNHSVVFEAVAELKSQGTEVLLICTGTLKDYRIRNSEYVDALRSYIRKESLGSDVLILGLIPYEDVLFLMRNCVAVINPSRFEGWSSTVEEARSIGKRVLLSNIPVHLEQNPAGARYFDPDDLPGLVSIMKEVWEAPDILEPSRQAEATIGLRERTLAYGERYIELVEEVQVGRVG
jgi:glycosyltransferase involved in cell wall biosynthesis